VEKEKALKIKETADLAALQLAREIQTYKDEKANELREQISRERGMYVTQDQMKGAVDRIEALLNPLTEYVSGQQGKGEQQIDNRLSQNTLIQGLFLIVAVIGLYLTFHH
jgi:hypothetical protein